MLSRTARFDQQILTSHTIAVFGEILYNGAVLRSGVPLSSGSVTADRSQFARRTCTVTVAGSSWVPQSASDPLTPFGHEIRLWRGVTYPDGATELMPIGVLGIRTVEVDEPAGAIAITGTDRCLAVSEARFLAPRTLLGGTSAVATIRQLLAEAVPWAGLVVNPTVVDIPITQVTYDTARDQAVTDIATAMGCEVFSDPTGAFVLQPIPDPNGASVYTIAAGPGGALITAKRTLTRDQVFNAVIATGSSISSTIAPSASVVDNDVNSPTYFYGPYGQVPAYYTSSLLTTPAQCAVSASALLRNFTGTAKSIDLTAVPNTALVEGDVITTVTGDGLSERHLLESLTIDLTAAQPFQGSTRSTVLATGLS